MNSSVLFNTNCTKSYTDNFVEIFILERCFSVSPELLKMNRCETALKADTNGCWLTLITWITEFKQTCQSYFRVIYFTITIYTIKF